ncbi:hypothetical protein XENOCAPTIV_006906 [Xenoophorus captivus]|uniref:Uncharacterized protein n=1 Tax=Xenoophorus captivus TaxID=1517983 RepID=A0ABV0R8L9_9TELE
MGTLNPGAREEERKSQKQVREDASSEDSIRKNQIKVFARFAPEADRLTVCPICVSDTVGEGARGVLRSLQPAAPPPPGDPSFKVEFCQSIDRSQSADFP